MLYNHIDMMEKYLETNKISDLVQIAHKIVIMQADNPDGDSLGSAVALENILGDMGKEPVMYCGVNIPTYLRYLEGWDRVQNDLPNNFDLSIIVDTSADSLFESLANAGKRGIVATKPCIIIDHHDVEPTINYATVTCNKQAVAAAEVIYEIAQQLGWPINSEAQKAIACGIMSDSLGLTSSGTSARSIHIIGELVESGISLAEIEHSRRELMSKSPELVAYKGRLLQRIEYFDNNRIASITIPWEEIEKYSYDYNPSMLVIDEMRNTNGVAVAIAFKLYKDGKITAKIRCNHGVRIAGKLAEHFGGGGHPYASGFKIQQARPINEVKSECMAYAAELLNTPSL
jgi:phosphoesterase RecJ-like protein